MMAKSGWIGRLQEQRKLLLISFPIYKPAAVCGAQGLSEPHVDFKYLAIFSWPSFHELVQTPSSFYLHLRKTLPVNM